MRSCLSQSSAAHGTVSQDPLATLHRAIIYRLRLALIAVPHLDVFKLSSTRMCHSWGENCSTYAHRNSHCSNGVRCCWPNVYTQSNAACSCLFQYYVPHAKAGRSVTLSWSCTDDNPRCRSTHRLPFMTSAGAAGLLSPVSGSAMPAWSSTRRSLRLHVAGAFEHRLTSIFVEVHVIALVMCW